VDGALAVCRFAHFLGLMVAFGVGLYAWVFMPGALRAALSPGLRRLATAASLVAFFGALAWLAGESAAMGDDWRLALDASAVIDVLTGTAFGRVWQVRLVLALALPIVLALDRRERWAAPTCLAGALLASLGLVDHAAMQTGAIGGAHRLNDAVHLLTAAGWLGGLIPFWLCLRAYDEPSRRADAVTAMMRFSTVGHFAVLALIATGILNIALISGRAPWPPTTPYRALLFAKILVVATMISIALANRYIFVPRVSPGAPLLRVLRATSLAELFAAISVVALVSLFGLLDPA
jgi:putative copper resistance protein D